MSKRSVSFTGFLSRSWRGRSNGLPFGSWCFWMPRRPWMTFASLPEIAWRNWWATLGQYSIRINDQWRICFEWSDGDAYEVEITDYH